MTDEEQAAVEKLNKWLDFEGPAELRAEDIRTVLSALEKAENRLWTDTCNSGHKTLPLTLWNCPVCEEEKRLKLEDKIKVLVTRVGISHDLLLAFYAWTDIFYAWTDPEDPDVRSLMEETAKELETCKDKGWCSTSTSS